MQEVPVTLSSWEGQLTGGRVLMVEFGSAQAMGIETVLRDAAFSSNLDGVELSYRVLDELVTRHRLESACLVVRPDGLGPQVFVHGNRPIPVDRLGELLSGPPGLYTEPEVLEASQSSAVAATCNLALGAQAARRAAAVDPASGLAGGPAMGAALAREAARSARYGWPFVAVLLAIAGEDAERHWPTLCGAVRRALRVGDEAGVPGPGRVLAVLGNAGSDVARPFAARVGSALSDMGAGDVELLVATARAPEETVDPEELWRLATERMAEISGGGRPAAFTPPARRGPIPFAMELEIRSLPGVVLVRDSGVDAPAGRRVVVVAVEPPSTLHSEVSKILAEQFPDVAVSVIPARGLRTEAPVAGSNGHRSWPRSPTAPRAEIPVEAPGRPPAPVAGAFLQYGCVGAEGAGSAPRVSLLGARFDPDTGASEVDLGFGTARGKGRAAAGPLIGGAQATLAALGELGMEVPYYVVSVERAPGVQGEPVVVVLAPRRQRAAGDPGGPAVERIGVANGTEGVGAVEAASRATLCALNRFLAIPKKPLKAAPA